ncbi:unnamed protein product [Urochloa decumbens]|uniref:Uncharacterized protein n=1 Tax=Urochloa decumbens TaxID=240449 RepID=A0ABC9BZ85_9POAL
MAAGGTCPRRRGWICRRRGGSKLGGHGGGNDDLVLKPGSRSRCGEWIYVHGHRIRRQGRMRVDANGDVYVPDSEDEEPDIEEEVGKVEVADLGGANAAADGMQIAAVGVPLGAISVGANTVVRNVDAAESIPADAVTVATKEGDSDGVKAVADTSTGDEMHPEVLARLKMVLPCIDPTFRDIFVSMLKVTSISIEIYSMHNNLFIFMEKMGLSFLDFIWYCV